MGREKREKAVVCVTVQNTGKRAGSEVVQIYAAYEEEVQRLCRFEKVFLQAGEKGSYAWQFQQMICRGMTAYPGGCASDRACIGFCRNRQLCQMFREF